MSTNEPMTREQIDAIRERADNATTGPWVRWEGWDDAENSVFSDGREDAPTIADLITEKADAEFISRAREDVPALLAEVERLRARLTVDDEMVERAAKALYLSDFMRRNNWATEDRARVSLESAKGGQIGGWMSTLEDARAALHVALNPYETEGS